MLEKGYVKESFGNALIEREEKYPTGLAMVPYPVAIPHTDPGHVNEACISIVRVKQGATFHEMVDVESIVKVNYIFCIALPGADKQTDVLQCLSSPSAKREGGIFSPTRITSSSSIDKSG